jgi:hypothetical protein
VGVEGIGSLSECCLPKLHGDIWCILGGHAGKQVDIRTLPKGTDDPPRTGITWVGAQEEKGIVHILSLSGPGSGWVISVDILLCDRAPVQAAAACAYVLAGAFPTSTLSPILVFVVLVSSSAPIVHKFDAVLHCVDEFLDEVFGDISRTLPETPMAFLLFVIVVVLSHFPSSSIFWPLCDSHLTIGSRGAG